MAAGELRWQTLEYDTRERSPDWFWALGIIILALSVASIIFGNYLFGIVILLAGGILVFINIRKPELITVTLSPRGIRIRDDLYLYQNIKSFWVEPEHPDLGQRHLLFLTDRMFMPLIGVRIPEELAGEIRDYMHEYVEEKEMHENPSYKILERLGL